MACDGSIDWCCWPRFDSGAVFCRLLDSRKGGYLRVGPGGRHSTTRAYAGDTNVLRTRVETSTGKFQLTSFMPVKKDPSKPAGKDLQGSSCILVLLEGLSGECDVAVEFWPSFDFARARCDVEIQEGGVAAKSGNELLRLFCPAAMNPSGDGLVAGTLKVHAGDRVWIKLQYGEGGMGDPDADLAGTLAFWQKWIEGCTYHGPYEGLVRRSALVLKQLIYSPTGALIAAPTTSLPEKIGGIRNWDYRYTWLRDSALILSALESIGYYDEALRFFEWLEALDLRNRGDFRIMYKVDGTELNPEQELGDLDGYRGSRPVRISNRASEHVQLDIYGEVIEAGYLCFKRLKNPEPEMWNLMGEFATNAARDWRKQDRSIWEVRGKPQDFVYSKLMCWVAVDRALRLSENKGLPGDVEEWRSAREELRNAILSEGFNSRIGAFTQAFGSDLLDASALTIPIVGFLPATDARVRSTADKIVRDLTRKGLVYRYDSHKVDDGLPGSEGVFTFCTFWLIDNLSRQGRTEEARQLFEKILRYGSDLGLLSEEIDPDTGEALGNYPQGFTHLGLIRSAVNIARAERKYREQSKVASRPHR